ncbi:hypothetical protein E0485_08365 [Paenibacillus albiflavus]|uniref:Uncharacterized protein n=1 Tax=Paenibacillus albiflavus TaxID=2545760 RepID=A0A4V2WP57_9BACL|nr:hypothetical protein [Paenibacillus albiflavus]TCZ78132.1 hypothetical protein E0485_08365 [Paenibacillus albiflavus]
MGNRTFLSVTEEAVDGQYEDVAFETNNFLALLWFSLVSQEQYQRYRERLLTTWNELKPHLENEELEDLPEWEAFVEALNWHIPWGEAVAQLRQSLPVTLARFPALGPYMLEWLATLFTHVQTHQSPVVHLELSQYFHFYEAPLQYLEQIEHCLHLWWRPDEFERWDDKTNPYLLGGEHVPKREGNGEDRQKDEPMATSEIEETRILNSNSVQKRSSKQLKRLYFWLLATLSAALFVGTLLLTSSKWLAVLAFLLPAICIVVWELLIRPRKIPSTKKERSVPLPVTSKITYYDGTSPIKLHGIEAVNLGKTDSFIVLWHHILRAQVSLPNQIVLILHTEFESLYPSPAIVILSDELAAEHIASAINSIASLWLAEKNVISPYKTDS